MVAKREIAAVAQRIEHRSAATRAQYEKHMIAAERRGPMRASLSCGNLAHSIAAAPLSDKFAMRNGLGPNIAIITSYNDMLSAHQPFEDYPRIIKDAVRAAGGTAQVAGAVPAMCDGVTQGQPGMELSLFSRDVIAQAAAIALSHNVFDGVLCLGVCDKIVPGLLIGALSFGHLPVLFVPAGPMPSGLPNKTKAAVRVLHAEGKASRDELLAAECASYHTAGTCTFYGTANTNQMLMEFMGLQAPGASFIHPNTPLREAMTRHAAQQIVELANGAGVPLWRIVTAKAVVNAIVGLLASGGSTNHTLHLIAIARAAGLLIDWDDFDRLSQAVPLLARVYPNGSADVNAFHEAGGIAFILSELLSGGLLFDDVETVAGRGLLPYTRNATLQEDGRVGWLEQTTERHDEQIVRPLAAPFQKEGGIRVLAGNLGRSVVKISAVEPHHRTIEAPARIFDNQDEFLKAFRAGELYRDVVVVVRFQGPRANGMPELHKLTPALSAIMDRGHKIALVSDGRMSGASGRVAAAIHLHPEAALGGPLAKLCDGDVIRLDAELGQLDVLVNPTELESRGSARPHDDTEHGTGRELFGCSRLQVSASEQGASFLFTPNDYTPQ